MPVKIANRTFRNIEQWQVDYIKENYQLKLTEIASAIGVDYRRVGEIINLLGLKRTRHWKLYLPKSSEVLEELKNPYLSHVEIAAKYGVTDACVARRRKQLGIQVRRKNYDTLIEQKVEKFLIEMDLAYLKQKRINKWSIDFYLGRKHCLDVHGSWSHSIPKVKDRDKRKQAYLKSHGYYYLVIHEEQLAQKDIVLQKIKEFTKGFPC
ncbi:endonuclease domain-containing protein [Halobacillus yeomjeoni]|uniref:endonuclease domain-containing protein n=1 Tax=Halobacillus yeomjeoni TaxID=311194 RepID=UPI001CD269F9|nr:endonuclease domain-containing protein [Halobacillus yeomjeoni]MCA0983255.1 endonuclease domain-containing protein [Halobacillus yeomjeoni]